MPARRPCRCMVLGTVGLSAALAGGCSSGHWSPTADAMAGAKHRAQYLAAAESPHLGTRTLVLSQDHYGQMANPVLTDASNVTATAGVETGE